jgi:hypothetical protein
MTDDIVARLRVLNHHAKKLAENESLHDLHRDALTRCENLTWQAADVIERLREELALSDRQRLRIRGTLTDEQLHQLMEIHKNYSAADEIERLRKERDDAEPLLKELWDRRTDATEMRDEIERLREALRIEQEESAACAIDRKETQRERDEARREVCSIVANPYVSVFTYAERRGWDCFKEKTHGH